MQKYINHRLCDRHGNRYSVFIEPISGVDRVTVFILKCSRKDGFNKRVSTAVFNNWKAGGPGEAVFGSPDKTKKIKKRVNGSDHIYWGTRFEIKKFRPVIIDCRLEMNGRAIADFLDARGLYRFLSERGREILAIDNQPMWEVRGFLYRRLTQKSGPKNVMQAVIIIDPK